MYGFSPSWTRFNSEQTYHICFSVIREAINSALIYFCTSFEDSVMTNSCFCIVSNMVSDFSVSVRYRNHIRFFYKRFWPIIFSIWVWENRPTNFSRFAIDSRQLILVSTFQINSKFMCFPSKHDRMWQGLQKSLEIWKRCKYFLWENKGQPIINFILYFAAWTSVYQQFEFNIKTL